MIASKSMKTGMAILAFYYAPVLAAGEPTSYELEKISLPGVEIKGRIQSWGLTKVCLAGQAYYLINGISGPNGIAPVFKEGKPEQCENVKTK